MKREILNIDFDLLQECCTDLGMELIPSFSNEFITLTDECGNIEKVMLNDNIFDLVEEDISISSSYNLGSQIYQEFKDVVTTSKLVQSFQYENRAQTVYAIKNNEYLMHVPPAA